MTYHIIKPSGVIAMMASQPFTTTLISSNKKMFKYCWYWEKNQGTNFFHCKRMPIRYIEEIAVFYKGQVLYNPQMTTGHPPTNSAKGTNRGIIYHGKSTVNRKGGYTTRFPRNILKFRKPSNYNKLHPTQKPVALMEYLIKTYTNKGDTVLDFAMGSGTTGVACKNLGRHFIGIEKDEEYFEAAKERIENGQ